MMITTFHINSHQQQQLIRIDEVINKWLSKRQKISGLCLIFVNHTTAGICITNKKDPDTALDIIFDVDRLIPTRVDFKHRWDTPRDAAGHVKTAVMGVDIVCPVINGELAIGKSQGIFFYEFDGPRQREFTIYIIQDSIRETTAEEIILDIESL